MDIEKRVVRLERRNRNLKKGIILAVVFIGGFFGLGQMSPASFGVGGAIFECSQCR